jgi:translation initiation factor 1
MSKSNTRLVWADDAKDGQKDKRKESASVAGSPAVKSTNWVAVFRLEKGGRGGKTVTVIDQLPKHETFLKDLCKELKSKCGSGGTYSMENKEGLIEIQGDKREAIKAIFEKKGYKLKGM